MATWFYFVLIFIPPIRAQVTNNCFIPWNVTLQNPLHVTWDGEDRNIDVRIVVKPDVREENNWRSGCREQAFRTAFSKRELRIEPLCANTTHWLTAGLVCEDNSVEGTRTFIIQTDYIEALSNVTIVAVTNTSLKIEWNKPNSDAQIIAYHVWKTKTDFSVENIDSTVSNFYEFGSLIPYTEYSFVVRARTGTTFGPWSETVKERTKIGVPFMPTGLTADAVTNSSIDVRWNEPFPSTGPIIRYDLKVNKSGVEFIKFLHLTFYKIDYLNAYTEYFIQVRAITEAGPGPWSSVLSVFTVNEGFPKFDPQKEHIVLHEGSLGKVECVAKSELPLSYKWYHERSGAQVTSDANQGVFTCQSANGSSLIFADVKRSHAEIYICTASNRHGTSEKLYDIIVDTTSDIVITNENAEIVNVKVVNVTDHSVEFKVETRGDPDSFYIRYKERLDKEENSVHIKKGEKAVVKYLVPTGRYEFRFQIESPSQVKHPLTPHYVTLLPGAPDVIFRSIKNGLVDVEWFRSIDDLTRDTIEEYELSYNIIRQIGGRSWEADDCIVTIKIPLRNCSTATYTIAGLQRRVYYEIRLRMRTSAGYGKPYVNKIYTL